MSTPVWEREVSDASGLPHIIASPEARKATEDYVSTHGEQVLVLSTACAAPTSVKLCRVDDFIPGRWQFTLDHTAGCAVFADSRSIEFCPHSALVIDLSRHDEDLPVLVTRGESRHEWLDRNLRHRLGLPSAADEASPPE
jgi:uncharacterized protein (DUF779 family)